MYLKNLKTSFIYFGTATVVLFVVTHFFIPLVVDVTGMKSILAWYLLGGIFVFIPLFFLALSAVKKEIGELTFQIVARQLRFHKLTKHDWLWTIGGLLVIYLSTGLITATSDWLSRISSIPRINSSPSFMAFHGLEEGEYWILLVWTLFFFFNIFGEEMLWRGYILPHQEILFGKYAWIINSLFWAVFHLSFGIGLMIILIPTFIVVPFIVQKRKNTWSGIIIHGIFNGSGFLALAFKLI